MHARRYTPIGLDLRGGSVCAAQLVRSGRAMRAHRLARLPLDPGAGLDERVERAQELLARRGFVGRECVIAAPRGSVRSGVVSVPPGAGATAINAIARSEIARTHELEPGSFEMACWALPVAAGAREESGGVLACVCPHDSIRPMVELFETVGIEVTAVDLESQAIARVCRRVPDSPVDDLRVILDLGWTQSLLIVMLGGTVLYERVMPEGALERLLGSIGSLLSLERYEAERALFARGLSGFDADAGGKAARIRSLIEEYAGVVAGELSMSIEYAARRHGVGDAGGAMLIGPGAAIPGIDGRLRDSCGLGVRVVSPGLALGQRGGDEGLDDPALVVALGLAERSDRG